MHDFVFPEARLTHPTSCVFFGDLYPNEECYDAETASGLRILLKIRKNVASGSITDYWENKNYVGWVRRGQGHKICAVIISNAGSYVPVPVSQSFECRKLIKMGNPLCSIPSSEPHTIRMFVGKVSCYSVYFRGEQVHAGPRFVPPRSILPPLLTCMR